MGCFLFVPLAIPDLSSWSWGRLEGHSIAWMLCHGVAMSVPDVRAGMSMYSVQLVSGYEMACCSDKRDGLKPVVSTWDSRSCERVFGFSSGWLGFGVSACRPFQPGFTPPVRVEFCSAPPRCLTIWRFKQCHSAPVGLDRSRLASCQPDLHPDDPRSHVEIQGAVSLADAPQCNQIRNRPFDCLDALAEGLRGTFDSFLRSLLLMYFLSVEKRDTQTKFGAGNSKSLYAGGSRVVRTGFCLALLACWPCHATM